eukprot:9841044-Lingulodinium_polyedra.AAC.1
MVIGSDGLSGIVHDSELEDLMFQMAEMKRPFDMWPKRRGKRVRNASRSVPQPAKVTTGLFL